MKPIPPVAIGLIVYNGEKYLAESIESVLSQDFGDFDFLISDNCSTDSTWEICNYYASKDNRIRLNRNKNNLGAITNSQFVVENTQSKYFMWHSHDDLLMPTYLSKCYEFLDNNHIDYVVCCTRTTIIDERGKHRFSLLVDESRTENDVVARYENHWLNGLPVHWIYGLIRKDVINRLVPFARLARGPDVLLGNQIVMSGKIHQINEVLRLYRQFLDPKLYMTKVISWGPQGLLGTRRKVSLFPEYRLYLELLATVEDASYLPKETRTELIRITKSRLQLREVIRKDISLYRWLISVYLLSYFPRLYRYLKKCKKYASTLTNKAL